MLPPDYFAFIWFQGHGYIRNDVSCDWKDIYLTKNEKKVVPNLRVDIFSMLGGIPLFTVFPSRGLAREFPDVSREQNLVDSFWS